MDEVKHFGRWASNFGAPRSTSTKLKAHKEKVIGKADRRPGRDGQDAQGHGGAGTGEFADPFHLKVRSPGRQAPASQTIRSSGHHRRRAPGGEAALSCRTIRASSTSTGALELRQRPKKMLVIGGGIIGLEMGTVYSTLGAKLDVVEMLDGLMRGADRDLVKVWQKMNAHRFDRLMLKTRRSAPKRRPDGIRVMFEGPGRHAGEGLYDLVLRAVGPHAQRQKIAAEKAGVIVGERGFIPVDVQMRTNVPHIFAIGDIVGQPMLAHKAVHEAHVAAEVAAAEKTAFDARVIPSVAYTDPEVAWVGVTEDEAKAQA